MSKRILYGKNPPISLVENLVFDDDAPYTIRYKELETDDLAILHYSDSIEISVYSNVSGHITIEQFNTSFSGNSVIIIPPNNIHSVYLQKGPGHVHVLHISPQHLSPFLNLERLFAYSGINIQNLPYIYHDYDTVAAHVQNMIRYDDNLFMRTAELLQLFGALISEATARNGTSSLFNIQNSMYMHNLIEWTEQNYNNGISLQDAAEMMGFSKSYFCSWFKQLAGKTYNSYLTDVKIAKACSILQKTQSVSATCAECGFRDMPYFIQLFKKKTTFTPLQYLKLSTEERRSAAVIQNGKADPPER